MNRIITNWENDLIESPEPMVKEWVAKHHSDFELKLLSGLRHRGMDDIYDSLRNSRIIVNVANPKNIMKQILPHQHCCILVIIV